MKKFQNKYRIPSARLQNWDYGTNAAYFITICTQNREHFFGKIVQSIVQSELNASLNESELGKIAEKIWIEIPIHFPYSELGNFVIMPNHIHGILIINKNDNYLEAQLIASLPIGNGGFAGNKNPMMNENISRIIRWYKGRCSFEMRKIHTDFGWQPRFYDHIIRDAKSFETIQNYIVNNPSNWKEDKFNNDQTT
jgi:putative transposase